MIALIYSIAALGVLGAGVYGFICAPSAEHRLIGLNVASVGILAVLVALAARTADVDPVTHAMVLTGLVVAASATALALAIVRRLRELEDDEQ